MPRTLVTHGTHSEVSLPDDLSSDEFASRMARETQNLTSKVRF